MAYQSRLYQSKWSYEPLEASADDFNSRVGCVLNRGAYLGHLHKSNMYASSIGLQELTSTSPTSESIPEASSTIPAHAPSIFTAAEFNYTWVDGTGKPVSSASASDSLAGKFATGLTATAHAQTKAYSKEVMDLWKRVNPGVMERYVDLPESTMIDHFRWVPEQQEPLNMTHHLKKTDFSEYNEVAARTMKGVITNKSSP